LLAVGLPGWQGLAALTAAFPGAAALAGPADRIWPRSRAGKVAGVAVMTTNLLSTAEKLDSVGSGGGKEGAFAFLLLPYLHISVALFAFPKAEPPPPGAVPRTGSSAGRWCGKRSGNPWGAL